MRPIFSMHSEQLNDIYENSDLIQHYNHIWIDANLLTNDQERLSNLSKFNFKQSDGVSVWIGASKRGRILLSDAFEPCQAVVAVLKNGEMVIYHADTMIKGARLDNFTGLFDVDEVKDIYVFQKNKNIPNTKKAPHLAVNIAEILHDRGKEIEVKRIVLEDYKSILIDADHQKIILADKMDFINGEFYKFSNPETTQITCTVIDENDFISLKQSVRDIIEQENTTKYQYAIPDFLLEPDMLRKKQSDDTQSAVAPIVREEFHNANLVSSRRTGLNVFKNLPKKLEEIKNKLTNRPK